MRRKIIGISAPARSGKDTVASMLLQYNNVAAYALADPLKMGCQALFGLTDVETWEDHVKEKTIPLWGYSPRQFFQHIGTEWMRAYNPDHWLMRAERTFSFPIKIKKPSIVYLEDPKTCFKLASQAFFGLSIEQTWDANYLDKVDVFWNMSPREMFNLIESLMMNDFPDYFKCRIQRPTFPSITNRPLIAKNDTIIIKDIRFENEASFLRSHGGIIWHVIRKNAQKVNLHSSEAGVKAMDNDIIIDNNGSLEQLALAVEQQWIFFSKK